MGRKTKKKTKTKNDDRVRSRRFFFFWLPIIILVIVIFWIIAMDPPQPTGRVLKAQVIDKDTSVQSPVTPVFKVKLENGEDASVAIPHKNNVQPHNTILVEEYSTRLFKKKSYQYRP